MSQEKWTLWVANSSPSPDSNVVPDIPEIARNAPPLKEIPEKASPDGSVNWICQVIPFVEQRIFPE